MKSHDLCSLSGTFLPSKTTLGKALLSGNARLDEKKSWNTTDESNFGASIGVVQDKAM